MGIVFKITGVPFYEALYNFPCSVCNDKLYWTMDPDPDGPTWVADCCDRSFRFRIETVTLEDDYLEEE